MRLEGILSTFPDILSLTAAWYDIRRSGIHLYAYSICFLSAVGVELTILDILWPNVVNDNVQKGQCCIITHFHGLTRDMPLGHRKTPRVGQELKHI